MARGPKKHLKRLAAPRHWMLDKLGGIFAPKPRDGPHKASKCLPLILIIRNRLKLALNYREALMIVKTRNITVDGKVRTDIKFPAGFMDVIQIKKIGAKFRMLYDTKGRFVLHKIRNDEELKFKLCKVTKIARQKRNIPYLVTHDGRTINYPDLKLKRNDTVVVDLATGKVKEWVRCKIGCLCMVTGGANTGRVGEMVSRERHPGSFDIVRIKDAADHTFATRGENVFVIGSSIYHPLVSLPKAKGVKLNIVEERERKLALGLKRKLKKEKKAKDVKKGKKGKKVQKTQKGKKVQKGAKSAKVPKGQKGEKAKKSKA